MITRPIQVVFVHVPHVKASFYTGPSLFAGLPPGLNKYRPRKVSDVIKWDFISKAWYSDTDANPRRRIDSYSKEGLDDVVREVYKKNKKIHKNIYIQKTLPTVDLLAKFYFFITDKTE